MFSLVLTQLIETLDISNKIKNFKQFHKKYPPILRDSLQEYYSQINLFFFINKKENIFYEDEASFEKKIKENKELFLKELDFKYFAFKFKDILIN